MDEPKNIAESVIAELEGTPLTPKEIALADLRRAATAEVTPGREAERDAAMRAYVEAVKSDPLTADYAERCGRARGIFWTAMRRARTPLPDPDPYGHLGRKQLAALGWLAEEVDYVVQFLGIKLEGATWDSVTINGRTYRRETIRLNMKPRYSNLSDSEWLARFPEMQKVARDHGEFVRMGGGEVNPNELAFERR